MSNFWKDFSFPSPIDDLLLKPDCTLESLLDQDDVIRDARSHKQVLVDFLARPEHVERLFQYVSKPAPEDASSQVMYRYPVVASEILVAEVAEIEKVIFDDPDKYIGALLQFWVPETVNIPLAALVSKVLAALLVSNTQLALQYLMAHSSILDELVKHVAAGTVKDHIGRMLTLEGGNAQVALDWLIGENLIGKYIALLDDSHRAIHGDVADAIIDLLEMSGTDSALFKSFSDPKNLTPFFENILLAGNRSALLHGLRVVTHSIEMIVISERSPNHQVPVEDTMPAVVKSVLDHLSKFMPILTEPYAEDFVLGAGTPVKPFGAYRLQIIQLLDTLLKLEFDAVDSALMQLDFFSCIMELFVTYEHNNVLHKVVEGMALRVIGGTNEEMINSFFKSPCDLHLRLVNAHKSKKSPEGPARHASNIPFIITLSEKVNEYALLKSAIGDILKASPEWMEYEKDTLAPARAEAALVLGGGAPDRMVYGHEGNFSDAITHDSEDDDEDDDTGSGSDEDDDEGGEEEEDDLDFPDDTDMPSDTDYRDYDSSQSDILLSKVEMEEYLAINT